MTIRWKTGRRSPKTEQFRDITLFAACTPKELVLLASLFDHVSVPAGEELIREGQVGREFFVIEGGTACVTLRDEPLAMLGKGDFFGEMALLRVAPRSATVTAKTPMDLLVLDIRGFARLLADAPAVVAAMMRAVADRLGNAESAPVEFIKLDR